MAYTKIKVNVKFHDLLQDILVKNDVSGSIESHVCRCQRLLPNQGAGHFAITWRGELDLAAITAIHSGLITAKVPFELTQYFEVGNDDPDDPLEGGTSICTGEQHAHVRRDPSEEIVVKIHEQDGELDLDEMAQVSRFFSMRRRVHKLIYSDKPDAEQEMRQWRL